MLLIMWLIMSIMYMLNSPITTILSLIFITISISMKILSLTYSSWLPLIIFLMMVGGMLILFIYMASISPNKKSHHISKKNILTLTFLYLFYLMIFPYKEIYPSSSSPILIFPMVNNLPFMIFSISYLFLFLLILTLILKKKEGPLRSF